MKPVRPLKETDPRVIRRMHEMVDQIGDLDLGDGLPLLRLPLPRARMVLVVGLQLYDEETVKISTWKTGEAVKVTHKGLTVPGKIVLASMNSMSLVLSFEGQLGGYAGTMPVLWRQGEYRDLIELLPVILERNRDQDL
jgi:hypothetical protein